MKFPLRVHSDYSIQKAFGHINEYVRTAEQNSIPAICLTDFNSISGAIELLNECKKKPVKPIIGVTTNIIINEISHPITVISLNKNGWYELVQLVSFLRSDINTTPGSITTDYLQYLLNVLFITNTDLDLNKYTNRKIVINNEPDVYYPTIADGLYQTIIENVGNHTMVKDILATRKNNSLEQEWSDKSEIYNLVEKYDVSDKPKIPKLIENGSIIELPDEYLRKLCRDGWVSSDINRFKKTQHIYDVYTNRIKEELDTISGAGLSNYMLLIRDIVNKCHSDKKSVNIRGSAVGSLVAYLSGISEIDPVIPDSTLPYNKDMSLLFERFINKGRISEGRVALPDIDIDIVPSYRDDLKDWIRQKYGQDKVANIITFLEIKGASAIKDVFRALDRPFEAANVITKCMVNEAQVQEEIEDAKSENPDYNIIHYCIDELPQFREFYSDFKYEIDTAARLCNTVRAEGQHAAGIVITSDPLTDFLPVKRENGANIVTLRMEDIEYCGGVKFDLLSVRTLEILDNIKTSIGMK